MVLIVTLGQQYSVGGRPTVILYTYINRHAGPPNTTKQKTIQYIIEKVVIIYDNNAIEPYNNRGLGQQKNVGEKPTVVSYCPFKLIAMQGHQNTKITKGTIS